ncbi:hypothetical protein C0992_000496 [Termitomyces sp. T32_za158]|nr:hypothetical protein C0992_000496 [Termitomyces sp. T32_za158]
MSHKNTDGVMPSHNAYSNERALPSPSNESNDSSSAKERIDATDQPLHIGDTITIPEGGIRAWLTVLGGIFMLSIVQPHRFYQNFLAQGVGMGIGMGLMFIPSLQVISHYFRKRRSVAMGIVITGELLILEAEALRK